LLTFPKDFLKEAGAFDAGFCYFNGGAGNRFPFRRLSAE
jgi:hypothetical protein